MIYDNICKAKFLARPNRFLARVLIDKQEETVHIKNTGRLRELLLPNASVHLCKSTVPSRKTAYDLVAVDSGDVCVNIDSQIPNAVACEWLLSKGLPGEALKREVFFGDSRFDICIGGENTTYMEVKGVTLVRNGVALFPDAPTLRGVKHIYGLCKAVKQGFEGRILFVVQRSDAKVMSPNDAMHPEFGTALREALMCGVDIRAIRCDVTPDRIIPLDEIEVRL